MAAAITVERNFGSFSDLALVTREDMRELGLLARERIVTRTRAGLGPDGVSFAPLSPDYAKAKSRALGTSSPDLTVSGNMLNHLSITEVTENTVTLGWDQ